MKKCSFCKAKRIAFFLPEKDDAGGNINCRRQLVGFGVPAPNPQANEVSAGGEI